MWHFGYAPDASSALFIHLPARHKTLILLANSDGLAAAFSLPNGDITVLALRTPVPEPLRVNPRFAAAAAQPGSPPRSWRCSPLRHGRRFPSSASADLYFSPYIALKFGGETTLLDLDPVAGSSDAADKAKKVTWGGSVMWLGFRRARVRGRRCAHARLLSGRPEPVLSSRVTTLLGNVVVAAPTDLTRESLRPYASAGWGLMRATSRSLPMGSVSRNLSAFNLGGGVIGMLSRRTGVRWDLRYLRGIGSARRGTLTGGRGSRTGARAWRW